MEEDRKAANADYTVVDREPLVLPEGTEVTTGTEDRSWKGWVWVIAPDNRGTYVPAGYLEPLDGLRARMKQSFRADDLSVKRGETVTRIREVNGWYWCRNAAGQEGWLPDYIFDGPSAG